jgi:hypothetical protein
MRFAALASLLIGTDGSTAAELLRVELPKYPPSRSDRADLPSRRTPYLEIYVARNNVSRAPSGELQCLMGRSGSRESHLTSSDLGLVLIVGLTSGYCPRYRRRQGS